MQKLDYTEGNAECVKLLEETLEDVRRGYVDFVGIATVEGNRFTPSFTGSLKSFHVGYFALSHLLRKLEKMAEVGLATDQPTPDAPGNRFIFDLSVEPVCHDFLPWLVTAIMMAKREGQELPVRINFVRRPDIDSKCPEDHIAYRNKFVENVFLPAIEMFGAELEQSEKPLPGRRHKSYAPKQICEWARAGEEVPRIRVRRGWLMADMLGGMRPVTITLRETSAFPHRNSNIAAWTKFARWLQGKGERVIFLRDTMKADEPLEDFEISSEGSRLSYLRASLYEQAKCNLFVANGPVGWAIFGSRPYICFQNVATDETSECNTPSWWARFQGIMPGDQWPWAGPQQRLVYAEDNFENLCAAWESVMEASKSEAA